MARRLGVGDTVYVPWARLGLGVEHPSAFCCTTVQEVVNRSVRVQLPGGESSDPVAASAVRTNVGILLVRVGDFETEGSLLDPLAKSLLQFCRLILPDDMIKLTEVRALDEFARIWEREHAAYSHLVLIGHGRPDAVKFGADWVTPEQFLRTLAIGDVTQKTIISMCCQTGRSGFGKTLSTGAVAREFVAPFHTVHGAVASHFCQTFFVNHLLQGETISVAFRHARAAVRGAASFRLWNSGRLVADGGAQA